MGLRFCNEAIMSLHQIWPRLEEPSPETLSPLQVSYEQRINVAIIVIEIMQCATAARTTDRPLTTHTL